MIRLALFVLLLGSPAAAWCTRPVENSTPQGPEIDQPFRMVAKIAEIPGYRYLVIDPTNRFALFTIREGRFEPLGAAFPYAGSWSYRDWYLREDGAVWGVSDQGSGHTLYILQPGAADFVAAGPSGFLRHVFDPKRQSMLLYYGDGGLKEWDGSRLTDVPFGQDILGPDGRLPFFVSHLGVYIARSEREIFAISPDAPTDWREVGYGVLGPPRGDLSIDANSFRVSGDGQLVSFNTGTELHVWRRSGPTEFKHLYDLEGWHDVAVAADGTLWANNLSAVHLLTDKGAEVRAGDALPEDTFAAVPPKSRGVHGRPTPSALFGGVFESDRTRGIVLMRPDGTEEVAVPTTDWPFAYVADLPQGNSGLIVLPDGLRELRRTCPGGAGWQDL